jgi:hypothetical protein
MEVTKRTQLMSIWVTEKEDHKDQSTRDRIAHLFMMMLNEACSSVSCQ